MTDPQFWLDAIAAALHPEWAASGMPATYDAAEVLRRVQALAKTARDRWAGYRPPERMPQSTIDAAVARGRAVSEGATVTGPSLEPETLAALAAAVHELAPPGFAADVACRDGILQVVVGWLPNGPSYGGTRRLDGLLFVQDLTAWVADAVRHGVNGVIELLLAPEVENRNAARELVWASGTPFNHRQLEDAERKLRAAALTRFGVML